ncbi:hypothetical protein SCLCIDRAFT_329775 [Scleroderma citrinum Foug A]|uniref:Uncharacterized protein n=1 Tax=Scleroderma citrinum Foug A TaxID=1036808 RepID=A0A0C3EF74_9AGAM|nr:hypothetical protein SCLCIDRAFT_329775 [Scleroderma citrinum Foug A]
MGMHILLHPWSLPYTVFLKVPRPGRHRFSQMHTGLAHSTSYWSSLLSVVILYVQGCQGCNSLLHQFSCQALYCK